MKAMILAAGKGERLAGRAAHRSAGCRSQGRIFASHQPVNGHGTGIGDERQVERAEPPHARQRLRQFGWVQPDLSGERNLRVPSLFDECAHPLCSGSHTPYGRRILR